MEYIMNGQIIDVISDEYIGSGSQWNVNRIILKNEILVNGIKTKQLIYKKPISSYRSIDENIEIYEAVKNAGLPTLLFYKDGYVDSERVIYGEDLNSNDKIFISPNSARKMDNSIQVAFLLIQNKREDAKRVLEDKASGIPLTELQIKNSKIKSIQNFEEIVQIIKKDMHKATYNNLAICADSYFFGLNDIINPKLEYKIADFDNISLNAEELKKENPYGNTIEMLCSLGEFVICFVENGVNHKEYEDKIEKIVQKIRGE